MDITLWHKTKIIFIVKWVGGQYRMESAGKKRSRKRLITWSIVILVVHQSWWLLFFMCCSNISAQICCVAACGVVDQFYLTVIITKRWCKAMILKLKPSVRSKICLKSSAVWEYDSKTYCIVQFPQELKLHTTIS
jgi:hypothetical protein